MLPLAHMKDTFLIVDGNALLHRAWHAIPPLTTKDGTVVNAVYGFAMVVENMLKSQKPTHMAVAWDLPGGTFRDEIYEDYKGTREKKEQELYDQIPMIQDLMEAFGIPNIEAEGYEADDIIGTLSKKAAKKGMKAIIVTGDLDSVQLVDDDVHVLFFQKGVSQTKLYDEQAVKDRYGLTPDQIIDYKALRGDSSDNIPGLKGVGDKTATTLLQEHGTIEGIYKAIEQDKVPEKFAKKFRGCEDDVAISKQLVTIVLDVKTDFRFPSSKVNVNWDNVIDQYRQLEFRNLLKKHGALSEQKSESKAATKSAPKKSKAKLIEVATPEDAKAVTLASPLVVLTQEQAANLFGDTLESILLTDGKTTLIAKQPKPDVIEAMAEHLRTADRLIGHDLKALMHLIDTRLSAELFDIMIASYLLHPGSRAHDLESVVQNQLDKTLPKQATATAELLLKLEKKMRPALLEAEALDVFVDLEMQLVPVLFEMERHGIELDVKGLEAFSKQLKNRIDKLTKSIHKEAGREFHIKSPSQLGVILFDELELPTKGIKKTKTGYSTAASELEKLWEQHAIIPMISEYRELTKLQSTYVESLPKLVAKDGRIHTTYNQTVAATGRLSSSDPNLQNIPIKTELGREIRKAFVAPRGKRLIAADYSQIELRLIAVIAKDEPFIEAFQQGADIHTRTASEVWEVAEEDVTKEQRRAAKAINFGIMYGMGPRALARSTGLTFTEAQDFIAKYFSIHKAIRDYLDDTKAIAHEQGYVETLFGRRRYLPELDTGIPMLVAAGERMAINHPIQGTAADLMKKAMLATDGWLKTSQWPAKMLLQVHDELVFEVPESEKNQTVELIRKVMEEAYNLNGTEIGVPLTAESGEGKSWAEAH